MEFRNNEYAPVIIPTLCRFEHFKRCIESLSDCTGAEKTIVYVGLDYPLKESHWDGYRKIKNYLENCGNMHFKKLIVEYRNRNCGFGPNGNYALLLRKILQHYDCWISTEDDNEFSPCFLEFMNKCLTKFKDVNEVTSISGYSLEEYSRFSNEKIIFVRGCCAWGMGHWKHKEIIYNNLPLDYYKSLLLSPAKLFKFMRKAPLAISAMSRMIINNKSWGDYKRSCYNINEGYYQIRPLRSLVRNWGFDGSGINCSSDSSVANRYLSKDTSFELPSDITVVDNEKLNVYMKWDLLSRNPITALKQLLQIPFFWCLFIAKNIFTLKKEKK